ncbi:MAG: methyltransferase domain-containing protein [Myxococcales bacterium]
MKPLHPVISRCRICQNSELVTILDLGVQALTGIFPKTKEQPVGKGPLELVKCHGGDQACGLVQLRHNYDPSQLFGDTYGYRSGLNESMVLHLSHTVQRLLQRKTINKGDVVLDIASNDGTTLSFFPSDATLIGMDPSAARWAGMYKPHIVLVSDFFSPERFLQASAGQRAKLITTIAMFYDLEDPLAFMRQVSSILADDGLWFLEQSYLPLMLKSQSYDNVGQEHLAYNAMSHCGWMASRVGLEIVDVELNEATGGSVAGTLAKRGAGYGRSAWVDELIAE